MKKIDLIEEKTCEQSQGILDSEDIISFQTEIPKSIQKAIKDFIEEHPNWY